MDAATAQDFSAHFLRVVADFAAAVVAVDRAHRSPVVACADDAFVLHDHRPDRLLQAGGPLLQHQTDAQEVLVDAGPELADYVLVVLWVGWQEYFSLVRGRASGRGCGLCTS